MEKNLGKIDADIANPDKYSYVAIVENNPKHNVIGNELGIEGSFASNPLSVHPSVRDTTICHGNYIYQDGAVQWDPGIRDRKLPASYYLKAKPDFLGDKPWPLIGGDLAPNTDRIPAQERDDDGSPVPGAGFTVAAFALPPAIPGLTYRHQLAVAGGRKPYTWRVTSGSLPAGMKTSSGGLISGSSADPAGDYPFTAEARDASAATASADLTLKLIGGDSMNLANGLTHVADSGNFSHGSPVGSLWDGDTSGSEIGSPGNQNIDSFWVEYDLGSIFRLKKVRLFGGSVGTWVSKSFRVEGKVSQDEPYTTLVDKKGCSGNQWYEQAISARARFVRLTVTGDTDLHRTQAREFEVLGVLE